MRSLRTWAMMTASLLVAGAADATCPASYGGVDAAKLNKLYLYYPPVDDAAFPEFGPPATSPARRFNAADLASYAGTTAALRSEVTSVVSDTYCEFNVQVIETTSLPPATFARRSTIGIGTDSSPGLFGMAEAVDTGDGTAVDFARVWGGTYQVEYGDPGDVLNGAGSTLTRWGRGIGGTVAHEAGHSYGVSHIDGLVVGPGEDVLQHHVMAAGSNYSGADRVGYRRHFSDNEFSILAANVGLSVQTMWNWDFVNPNEQTAARFRMDFLSLEPSLTVSWDYDGPLSPWDNPSVSGPLGPAVFQGVTYNRFRLEWSTGQAWTNGAPGQVPGGAAFHVGAAFFGVDFSTPVSVIIRDVALLDADGAALALNPRHLGFNPGTLDLANGLLALQLFNMGRDSLVVRDVQIQQLPRVLSLDAMVPRAGLFDPYGRRFDAYGESVKTLVERATVRRGGALDLPVVRMADGRRVVEEVTEETCRIQDSLKGIRDTGKCRPGLSVGLFPATAFYITARVIDPDAKVWDPDRKEYVQKALESKLYYQVAGRRPDLNKNGQDDFIDIATGRSTDKNKDGVPDEVQG